MKKLLFILTLSTAAIGLVGCTGFYEPYPVVSSGSNIHQSHYRHYHYRHYHYRHNNHGVYHAHGPVVHTNDNSGIFQNYG